MGNLARLCLDLVIKEFRTRDDEHNVGIDDYPSYCDYDKKIHIDYFAVLENMDDYRDEGMGDDLGSKEISTNIGGEFTNLEFLKCWSLETSRWLFNTILLKNSTWRIYQANIKGGRDGVSVPALTKDHKGMKLNTPYPEKSICRIEDIANTFRMDDPNITMEEYIRLEEEKARKRRKVFNWETAKYGKIWYDEDIHDLRSVETEFSAITFNDEILGVLTVISPELLIIDMAVLVRLSICKKLDDTWAWVAMGPERQPDAAVGAPGVAQDAPVIDKGSQAYPTPVEAPLPPPAAARTML
ncbi:hypothetical protein Tco_0660606 [Tanacetum coccineum]